MPLNNTTQLTPSSSFRSCGYLYFILDLSVISNSIHLHRILRQALFRQHISPILPVFLHLWFLLFNLQSCLHSISLHPILNSSIFNRFLQHYSLTLNSNNNNNNNNKYRFNSIQLLSRHRTIPMFIKIIHTSMIPLTMAIAIIISSILLSSLVFFSRWI